MSSAIDRVREYFEKIIDWTCLEKLNLRKAVVVLLVLDFVSSIVILVPTMAVNFVYVHDAGKVGFVDRQWVRHVDIYKYRRFQPWELEVPIDWEEGDRLKIASTRSILDKTCSTYDPGSSIPGDPGDYLKEVAGHPTSSGYNQTLRLIINLWTAAISMFYFSCPILLLALWWRAQTTSLIMLYILVQLCPMILLVISSSFAKSQLMCAVDIIYGRVSMRSLLIAFIVIAWLYEIIKFVILILYCVEQHLTIKRKVHGFRRRRTRKLGQVVPASSASESGMDTAHHHQDHDNFDVERAIAMERRRERKSNPMLGHSIAQQILQIGEIVPEDLGPAPKRNMLPEEDPVNNLSPPAEKRAVSFSKN
ncbi:hypothetical protein Ocin01_13049 [Orchesella cincta]|uniref:Uncharacterized protein n=1 Tax=Orchesella cincta TaxID=48709 RepID=A0A1D2MKR2_ORCCI|nr:hypothetical protein Ocin01_13049 [Orchesella cincta]